ncbi:MAG: hypothetical protein K0V04_18220 [Deltaproteobacteria bacterium]|nr:hypothetical protein [Deltaproteobacteria bacterium]
MSAARLTLCLALSVPALSACDSDDPTPGSDLDLRGGKKNKPPKFNTGTDNVHLERSVRFNPIVPGTDADNGRAVFGSAVDEINEDTTNALFEGDSLTAQGTIVSNGRTCFTCHRGDPLDWGLPAPPLSATIAATDALFTGIDADAQGDPDAAFNLDQLALFKIRPNRFNPTRADDDPFRRVFGWRKSPQLTNVGLSHGMLTDLRGRTMFEVARGAVFAHTQPDDARFDDLFSQQDGDDIAAFLFGQVSDPVLSALRDRSDPMHDVLVDDPFFTVPISTNKEHKGKKVFEKYCLACHDTPGVFNNLANVEPLGNGDRPTSFPPFAPGIGRTFNVGVSEANVHGLRFSHDEGNGTFSPIVLPLAAEDGTLVEFVVDRDVGLAATTGRHEDIGRFKVPALRNLAAHAPFFHDNSAATIEEVVDFFCSDAYNDSADGQHYPIHLNAVQRSRLIALLYLL